MRRRAIRELRRNLRWRGVWGAVRHYGVRRFLREPRGLYERACALTDGAFT